MGPNCSHSRLEPDRHPSDARMFGQALRHRGTFASAHPEEVQDRVMGLVERAAQPSAGLEDQDAQRIALGDQRRREASRTTADHDQVERGGLARSQD